MPAHMLQGGCSGGAGYSSSPDGGSGDSRRFLVGPSNRLSTLDSYQEGSCRQTAKCLSPGNSMNRMADSPRRCPASFGRCAMKFSLTILALTAAMLLARESCAQDGFASAEIDRLGR